MSLTAILVCALVSICTSQIRVLSPMSLEQDPLLDQGIIYGTTAIFGAPEYGRRTLGEVVYYAPSKEHCEASDMEKYPAKDASARADDMKIYVLDRGGCPFEKKVRLAQERGADAVIIVDFPCSRQKEIATNEGHPDTPCRDTEGIQRIVMADTSGARDIHIPSILIARAQGERLIGAITAGSTSTGESQPTEKQVVVMLLWDIPRADFVSVDFWMSSAATDTSFFMSQFSQYASALGSQIQFVPHYSLTQMSSDQVYGSSRCLKSQLPASVADVYFCDSQLSPLGEVVVREDARQLCVWHASQQSETTSSNKAVSFSPMYWQYVAEFFEECHPSRNRDLISPFNDECANSVMKKVGIDSKRVNWCLDHMQPPQCQDSSIRKSECASSFHLLQDQAAHQAWSPHALRINGWRYSGPLEASVVLRTICQGFVTVPDICNDVPLLGAAYKGLSTGMTWFLSLSMLAVVILAGWVYRRHLKHSLRSVLREEVMLEVRSQMADYAMLAEDEENVPRSAKVLEMSRFTPQGSKYGYSAVRTKE